MSRAQVLQDIDRERDRQEEKFPGQVLPLGFGQDWSVLGLRGEQLVEMLKAFNDAALLPSTSFRWIAGQIVMEEKPPIGLQWLTVLLEELFEATVESDPAKARAELVQTAAVCVRIIEQIDREAMESVVKPLQDLAAGVITREEFREQIPFVLDGDK